MIKFGFSMVVVYFVCFIFTNWYIKCLAAEDQFAYYIGVRSTKQNIWLIILGILRLAALVFGAIAVILFVCRFLG